MAGPVLPIGKKEAGLGVATSGELSPFGGDREGGGGHGDPLRGRRLCEPFHKLAQNWPERGVLIALYGSGRWEQLQRISEMNFLYREGNFAFYEGHRPSRMAPPLSR